MSIYNALYGRDGHGVGPNEPEKKGFARFARWSAATSASCWART